MFKSTSIIAPLSPTDASSSFHHSPRSPTAVDVVGGGFTPLDAAHLNRIHEELEKLNISTDVINKLELQLDEARAAFREIHTSWSQRLEQTLKKYGSAIEKGRPYYELKLEVRATNYSPLLHNSLVILANADRGVNIPMIDGRKKRVPSCSYKREREIQKNTVTRDMYQTGFYPENYN
jgi:hypothetical protein